MELPDLFFSKEEYIETVDFYIYPHFYLIEV